MAKLYWTLNVTCAEWSNSSKTTCNSLVAEVDPYLICMIIAILVIAAVSLLVAMGGILATSYLARLIREDKQKKDCDCFHRKSTLTQSFRYEKDTSHQMPVPGLTTDTPSEEFVETRARSATSPDIFKAEGSRRDSENTKTRDGRLGKLGLRFNRKSDVQEDQVSEKKKKKEKILMGHSTPNDLLQNMRVINYELTGKGDFKPPSDNKNEDSDECPLVVMSSEMPSPEREQPTKAVANGNPVYYTLETVDTDDNTSSNNGAGALNSFDEDDYTKKSQRRKTSSAALMPNNIEQRFSSRSMSDAFETKRKRPSFKIVSTSKRDNKKVDSATWNPRQLAKNKHLQHHRSGSVDQGRIVRASQVYEDVDNGDDSLESQPYGGSGGVEFHSYGDVQPTVGSPGSYSLLSRSLENGLAGYKEWVDLPGYQQLNVGSPEDRYDMSVGVMV